MSAVNDRQQIDRKLIIDEWVIMLLSGLVDLPRQSAVPYNVDVSAIEESLDAKP